MQQGDFLDKPPAHISICTKDDSSDECTPSYSKPMIGDEVMVYFKEDGRAILYRGKIESFQPYKFPWGNITYKDGTSSYYFLDKTLHSLTWRHATLDDPDVRDLGSITSPEFPSAASTDSDKGEEEEKEVKVKEEEEEEEEEKQAEVKKKGKTTQKSSAVSKTATSSARQNTSSSSEGPRSKRQSSTMSTASPKLKQAKVVLIYDDKDDNNECSYNGLRPPPSSDLSRLYDGAPQLFHRAVKNDIIVTYWIEDDRVLLYKGKVLGFTKYSPPWAEVEYHDGSTSFYYLGRSDHNKTWRHAQIDDNNVRDIGPAPEADTTNTKKVNLKPAKSRGTKTGVGKAKAKVKGGSGRKK